MRTVWLVVAFVAALLVCRLLWWLFDELYFGSLDLDELELDGDELESIARSVAAHPAGASRRVAS
jgi:hypothetical protein